MLSIFADDPLLANVFQAWNSGESTLFLPNNAAAMSLATTDITDAESIAGLLYYHAVQGEKVCSGDLECDGKLNMFAGGTTATKCDNDIRFQVGDGNAELMAKIVGVDIETCNGVVHIVDQIVQPG